jgi:hypothetical protein
MAHRELQVRHRKLANLFQCSYVTHIARCTLLLYMNQLNNSQLTVIGQCETSLFTSGARIGM